MLIFTNNYDVLNVKFVKEKTVNLDSRVGVARFLCEIFRNIRELQLDYFFLTCSVGGLFIGPLRKGATEGGQVGVSGKVRRKRVDL